MLLSLTVENFYSIRDRVSLNFRLNRSAPQKSKFLEVPGVRGVRVPSTIAILGANGSGKSTLLRAIAYMHTFAKDSFSLNKPGNGMSVDPFNDATSPQKKTKLKAEFSSCGIILENENAPKIFRYEIEIKHCDEGRNYISMERLSYSDDDRNFELLFSVRRGSRDADAKVVADRLELGEDSSVLKVRNNVSLLSQLNQFDFKIANTILQIIHGSFVSNIYLWKYTLEEKEITNVYREDSEILNSLNRMISILDIGIDEVKIFEVDGEYRPFFYHNNLLRPHSYLNESEGTKSFYKAFHLIARSLNVGATALLDELDSDLHPDLLAEIFGWFQRKSENRLGAQLVTTCNHASILNHLDKDEVILVDKGRNGVTQVTQLSKARGIRRDHNLYNKYIAGILGGVPNFG